MLRSHRDDAGFKQSQRRSRPDSPRAAGIVGAIWERIATFVLADEFDSFPEQVPELMYLSVFPYLGGKTAREELQRGPEDIARYRRGEI